MPYTPPLPNPKPKRGAVQNAISTLAEAERMMQIAFILPSAAFVGWLLGVGADHLFGTKWIAVIGILFGGFSGIYYVIRLVLETGKRADAKEKAARAGQSSEEKKRNQEK